MEMEKSQFGSIINRTLTSSSLHCFEAMELPNTWSYLSSADGRQHHSTWINMNQKSLLTYCEGDVILQQAPDDFVFSLELNHELEFCKNA